MNHPTPPAAWLHPRRWTAASSKTVWGGGLANYTVEAKLIEDKLTFEPAPAQSGNPKVLAPLAQAFSQNGGLKVLSGNLGKSVIKVSAVKPANRVVEARARVFHTQDGMQAAFKNGELNTDVIAVVRFQGPAHRHAGAVRSPWRSACCRRVRCA